MKIFGLTVNRSVTPLGIDPKDICFSFLSDTDTEFTAELLSADGASIAKKKIPLAASVCFRMDASLRTGTRYRYCVSAEAVSAETWFETGIDFKAPFITPADETLFAPALKREFSVPEGASEARLYLTGLGLFCAEINGKRVGREYLTPGFNDYDAYLRYCTYDVTDLLMAGGNNLLVIYLGDGWYKGRIGIDKPADRGGEVFGSRYLAAAELTVRCDGEARTLLLTDERFIAVSSPCLANSIYDGEIRDYTAKSTAPVACVPVQVPYDPIPYIGAPVTERMVLTPTLYVSPKGEQILDFGQNMVGFVRFSAQLPLGTRVRISHGEVLQDGCFYSDNLRTAKAEAVYISDGNLRTYEPMFTYFGFRYARVEGMDRVDPADFAGVVISSDLMPVSDCVTDSDKINRLIQNTVWGQRGNFLDVPTDCPQRDERLGWTADTQVFSATACYQADCYSFYKKYLRDLRADQTRYYAGDFPMYSPSLRHEAGNGGAVWADCGTILPWNLYRFYGDRELLRQNYPMMKEYTEVLISRDREAGGRNLILHGFTFGDWLAQDGVCAQSLAGGTDTGYIQSIYYYHSVCLTAQAASAIGHVADAKKYREKAGRIREAILDEYFAPGGKLALDTQTSYVLSLYYGVYRDRQRVIADFRERLSKDFYRMKTGFTGTPLILPALFDNGMDEDAFRILYNEECPGWLYAVNLGATTVWERWNSLLPDGKISGTNMNSLNHYAYGSVCESIYSRIAGLREAEPGWHRAIIEPHPDWRMKQIRFTYLSAAGRYAVSWQITEDGNFWFEAEIPAGCMAEIRLPDRPAETVGAGTVKRVVKAPDRFIHPFSLHTPNLDILANSEAADLMRRVLPQAYAMVTGENEEFKIRDGRFFGMLPMFGTTPESMERYERGLRAICP